MISPQKRRFLSVKYRRFRESSEKVAREMRARDKVTRGEGGSIYMTINRVHIDTSKVV